MGAFKQKTFTVNIVLSLRCTSRSWRGSSTYDFVFRLCFHWGTRVYIDSASCCCVYPSSSLLLFCWHWECTAIAFYCWCYSCHIRRILDWIQTGQLDLLGGCGNSYSNYERGFTCQRISLFRWLCLVFLQWSVVLAWILILLQLGNIYGVGKYVQMFKTVQFPWHIIQFL